MPFRRPNSAHWYVQITTPGGAVRKSTGTSDRSVSRAIERALHELVHRREWDLLNAMIDDKVSVGELYDAFQARSEDALR